MSIVAIGLTLFFGCFGLSLSLLDIYSLSSRKVERHPIKVHSKTKGEENGCRVREDKRGGTAETKAEESLADLWRGDVE